MKRVLGPRVYLTGPAFLAEHPRTTVINVDNTGKVNSPLHVLIRVEDVAWIR